MTAVLVKVFSKGKRIINPGLGGKPRMKIGGTSKKGVARWVPLPPGWIKINVDGAFDAETLKAGLGS